MRHFGTVVVMAAMLAATGARAGANLIADGGFETPNLGSGNYTYPAGVLGSWTYDGAALVNAQGASAWYGATPPAGQEGAQFAALQASSSLSQSFTATASSLLLSWLNAGRPYFGGYNGDQTYEVLLDGAQVGTYSTTSGQAFAQQSLVINGLSAGSSHTLTYHGLVQRDETAFLDKISLSAVPEPATWAMMILGFGAIGLTLRGGRRTRVAPTA
ncbi:MAG TPA: PEPxxWA-CTERM sorting domain-containing protein [Phenylobacterium sp.]|nr:PEPxxWA-CTERM sorting domain-containing protein [Phenylobacterium sp.]